MDTPAHPGDSGSSSLPGGKRLPKDDAIFEALGAVDELSAALGVARAELSSRAHGADAETLREIQRVLLRVGTDIATSPASEVVFRKNPICQADIEKLNDLEEELRSSVEHPRGFVLPGAATAEALIHVARASCRTAERRVVSCAHAGAGHLEREQRYLNRLSSCLYWLSLRYGAEV